MSEHIHEDSFFCGGAVGQKVNDFIIECFARASQVISKEIVGGYIKGVSEGNSDRIACTRTSAVTAALQW